MLVGRTINSGTALRTASFIALKTRRAGAWKESDMSDKCDIRPNSREEAGDERETDHQDHVVSIDEKLEEGLKDSMDASDPPSTARSGDNGDPVPSSGYREED
tara:strand:- start:116 stop:424 length:309 start_codon:yes stop_codon:yes gene_type:complete